MHVTTTMLLPALALFKYKAVSSIIVLACWDSFEQVKLNREISANGFRSTFVCDPSKLDDIHSYGLQGVLYFMEQTHGKLLTKAKSSHFSERYIWILVGKTLPAELSQARYDAEMVLLRENEGNETNVQMEDILVHPDEGLSSYPWADWSEANGLVVQYDRERITRRLDLKGYPIKVAAPVGTYSEEWYNGSYTEYIVDETLTELDSGIRCGYAASMLIVELLNATHNLTTTELWSSTTSNNSMSAMLTYGHADLSGSVLRILHSRLNRFDFIMPIWPFHVGFTYLGERESSSNMFVTPFTANVWWSCLVIIIILAGAQRATARSLEEKNDAYCAVIATFLQQDASAVPKGFSGRWTFLVLSIYAMLVHAYYTSAIVSALMSAGTGGPETIRALADSRYSITSEDYDYMRYLFFDVETTWEDLEYLKRKKKTSKFYYSMEEGAKLIKGGNTAFHTEYNQLYPHIKSLTDDQICKLQYVDTVPEVVSWVTSAPNGQFTSIFRSAGAKLNEVGLGKRVTAQLRALRPTCRAQMLAERVKLGDILPLLELATFGVVLSLILLGLEILIAKWKKKGHTHPQLSGDDDVTSEYDQ